MMTGPDVVRQALEYFFGLQEMNEGGKDMLFRPHFFLYRAFQGNLKFI